MATGPAMAEPFISPVMRKEGKNEKEWEEGRAKEKQRRKSQ